MFFLKNTSTISKDPRGFLLLICIFAIMFAFMFSVSSIFIMAPSIAHLTLGQMQWTLTFRFGIQGCLILYMGRVGDKIGNYNIFIISIILLIIGTILLAIGLNHWIIITGIVIAGAGSAGIFPATLALCNFVYTPEAKMKVLIGYLCNCQFAWGLGTLFGGLTSEYLDWRFNFWVALGLYVIMLPLVIKLRGIEKNLRKPVKINNSKIDYTGIILLALFTLALILLFSQAHVWGLTSGVMIALYAVTPVLFVLFVLSQFYIQDPIFPVRMLKNIRLSIGSLIMFFNQFAWCGWFYLFILYGQSLFGKNHSIIFSASSVLPIMFIITIFGSFMPYINRTFGYLKPQLIGGIVLFAGILIFFWDNQTTSYANLWWRVVLIGIGLGIAWLAITPYAYSRLDKKDSGHGSGILETFRFIGSTMGILLADIWYQGTFISQLKSYLNTEKISSLDIHSILSLNLHPGATLSSIHTYLSPHMESLVAKYAPMALNTAFRYGIMVCAIGAAIAVALSFIATIIPDNK